MKTHKVAIIFGTRPEVIKLGPLILEIEKDPYLKSFLIHTGQHKELTQDVMQIFNIKPKYNLEIMKSHQTLTEMTLRIGKKLEKILKLEMPDLVIVQGDTTTTLMGCLVSYYLKFPVAHVEAGLRTGNIYQPFPEEVNRKVVDSISELLFVPTKEAKENLIKANISKNKIFIVGNTVIDALLYIKEKYLSTNLPFLKKKNLSNKKIIVFTLHRRENWEEKTLREIAMALKTICINFKKEVEIFYPCHPNPFIKKFMINSLGLGNISNFHVIKPLRYDKFITLLSFSSLILTDSGGIQEEASYLGKPVFILRNFTERREIIDHNIGKIIGTNKNKIINEVTEFLSSKSFKVKRKILYGKGNASKKIKKEILKFLMKK